MRDQAGLLEHPARDVRQVMDGRLEAHGPQLVTSYPVAPLRLVAEGEERLGAAGLGCGTSQSQDLVLAHERASPRPGRFCESAVAAVVAAELGQRQERLWRVRDSLPVTLEPDLMRRRQQRLERLLGAQQVSEVLGIARPLEADQLSHVLLPPGTQDRRRQPPGALDVIHHSVRDQHLIAQCLYGRQLALVKGIQYESPREASVFLSDPARAGLTPKCGHHLDGRSLQSPTADDRADRNSVVAPERRTEQGGDGADADQW